MNVALRPSEGGALKPLDNRLIRMSTLKISDKKSHRCFIPIYRGGKRDSTQLKKKLAQKNEKGYTCRRLYGRIRMSCRLLSTFGCSIKPRVFIMDAERISKGEKL